jgi:GDPmannose 4,6-dehydratase
MKGCTLVLGASGQDGLILSRALALDGVSVVGTCRSKESVRELQSYAPSSLGRELDVRSFDDVLRLMRELEPSAVYNLAAISSVQESWDKPHEVFDTNLVGALNVLESVRILGLTETRVYQASSSEMFGGSGSLLNEESPFVPKSPYGASKLAAHNLIRMYRESYGVFASSGILFNHESPLRGGRFVSRKVSKQAAEIHLGLRSKIEIGNLDSTRDWGWAPDYVKAMRLIMGATEPGDYVVASGIGRKTSELIQSALFSIGITNWRDYVSIDKDYYRPNDPAQSIGDSAKIQRELGWSPSKTFEEMVSDMVRHDISLGSNGTSSQLLWYPS